MRARSVELLPVITALADLRRAPDHGAELLSQIPHGHLVRAARRSRDRRWVSVLAPDGLRGWTRSWSLGEARDAARSLESVGLFVTVPWIAVALANGDTRPLPLGSRVIQRSTRLARRARIAIELADGSEGEIDARHTRPEPAHAASLFVATESAFEASRATTTDWPWVFAELEAESVLDTARALLGVPYLWGGTSPGGLDCSGLVRLAFLAHGVPLPRDARDQAAALREFECARRPCRAGDLLFFGRPGAILHGAIAENARSCLHASGDVRRTRLDRPSLRDRELLKTWFLTVRPPYGARLKEQR